ncbi:MAG: hypothetical protein Q8J88_06995 [Bacteroidales bacterium]|nr:hypothetical protein [Bacteroidales bacterium]
MKGVLIVIFSFIMLGCHQLNNQTAISNNEPIKKKEAELKIFLDNFFLQHHDCFNNDIKIDACRKMFILEFYSFMTNDSINFLSEVEVRFEQMAPYPDGDYVVKFHHGSHKLKKVSDSYDLTFQVFAKVNKDVAQKLVDGKKYILSGNVINYATRDSFVFPSGEWLIDYPTLEKALKSTSYVDEIIYINLGSLIIENLEFTRVWGEY